MQLKTVGESENVVKTINEVIKVNQHLGNGLFDNATLAHKLSEATSQYSTEAIKAAIKQSTLDKTQIKAILTKKGLKGEILETTSAELAEITATNMLSASEGVATASTLGLSNAFKGLWAIMKANPILFVAAGFTAVMAGINAYNKYQEELAEKTRTATTEVKNATDSIEEYASKYEELYTELTNANTTEERQSEIKKEILKIQQELNEAYGDECGKINLVSDAYTNQINKIKELSKEKSGQWLAENNEGIQQATKQMEKERTYTLGLSISSYDASGQAIKDLAESFKDAGIEIDPNESTGTFDIRLKANAEDADKTISEFVRKVYSLKEQFKNDTIIDDVLNTSNGANDKVDEILGKYQQQYNQAKMYQIADSEELSKGYNDATIAVQEYNEALVSGDDSKIKESRAKLEAVKNSIDLTSDTWKSYAGIINDVFDQADTRLVDFKAKLESQDGQELLKSVKGYTETELRAMADDGNNGDAMDILIEESDKFGLKIEDVISLLKELGIIIVEDTDKAAELPKAFSKQEMISAINGLSEGFESLDKIYESISDKNPFDFKLLDDKKFTEIFDIPELEEEYTNFVETISSSPNDINGCKEAFNQLVTAWIDSKGVLDHVDESNAQLTTDMLKNMGVANASEVVIAALAQRHADAAWNARDLSDATSDEIDALAKETEATETGQTAFKLYIAQKLLSNAAIDPTADITALANIVESLGIATNAWKTYYAAKREIDTIQSATKRVSSRGITYYDYTDENGISRSVTEEAYNEKLKDAKELNARYRKDLENQAKEINLNTNYVGGNKSNTQSGSKGSDTTKDIDYITRKVESLKESYSDLINEANDSDKAFANQLTFLNSAIDKQQELIEFRKQAESVYKTEWETLASTLSAEEKSLIMNGGMKLETYKTDDDKYKVLEKAMDAWDRYDEMFQARQDDEEELFKNQRTRYQKNIEWQKDEIDQLIQKSDIEQVSYKSQIDYLNEAKSKSESLTAQMQEYANTASNKWNEVKQTIEAIDISKIMNGTLNLEDYKNNPEYYNALKVAIQTYEDLLD